MYGYEDESNQRNGQRNDLFDYTYAAADYEKFLSEAFSDVELHMNDGKILKAQKAILMDRSPVFFGMLTNEMQEESQYSVITRTITDITSKTMKVLLEFIYYDKVEYWNYIDITNLLYAADKYKLDKLKQLCFQKIISGLSGPLCVIKANVIKALVVSDRFTGTEAIFQKCLPIVVQ